MPRLSKRRKVGAANSAKGREAQERRRLQLQRSEQARTEDTQQQLTSSLLKAHPSKDRELPLPSQTPATGPTASDLHFGRGRPKSNFTEPQSRSARGIPATLTLPLAEGRRRRKMTWKSMEHEQMKKKKSKLKMTGKSGTGASHGRRTTTYPHGLNGRQIIGNSWMESPKVPKRPKHEPSNEDEPKIECDEIEMEVEDPLSNIGPPIIGTDPLLDTSEIKGNRCLICFRDDPDPYSRPLKGLLPKQKNGLNHPEQLEDDMRIIYLLKMIFQLTSVELNKLMELSEGESPREWIHLCQSCRLFVFEIQTLEDRMRECRKRITNKIIKSNKTSTAIVGPRQGNMTTRIRSLVTQQVKSTKVNNSKMKDGDWQAKRRVDYQMQGDMSNPQSLEDFSGDSNSNQLDNLPSPEWNGEENEANASNSKVSKKDFIDPTFNEVFTCPYGCLEYISSTQKKMNIAEMVQHLIYHYDYPMNCSECKVFLQRDSSVLDAHWRQYHSDINTVSEKRFLEKQVILDDEKPLTSEEMGCPPVKCVDCPQIFEFDTMSKFKIHQALEHPQVARLSCPFCLEKFPEENQEERRDAMMKHMKDIHNVGLIKACLKSNPCKYCGEMLSDNPDSVMWRSKLVSQKVNAFHAISRHCDLIKATYTCTQCSLEFSYLQEFVQHSDGHPEISLDRNAVHLCFPSRRRHFFQCGLCTKVFQTVTSFTCHLTLAHSLYLKWMYDPLNPSVRADMQWKPIQEHVKEMTILHEKSKRIMENLQKERVKAKAKASSLNASSTFQFRDTKLQTKYVYSCPVCPQLRKMTIDAFIVHLLFHWRHPNKCTSCQAYLPLSSELIDEHWKHHHAYSESTMTKYEPAPFTSGNIFWCLECPEKFVSHRDRNEHELSHGISSTKITPCNICNERFINTNEVRLHKALDHPEVASLSCFHCEDLFPAESVEGVQYLDSEALHQHILQKDDCDHPKSPTGQICHLKACDLCGEVLKGNYKRHDPVRHHILKMHGPKEGKITLACFICNKGVIDLWGHLSSTHSKNCICETCGEEMRPRGLPDHNLVKHGVLMEGYARLSCKEKGCQFETVYPIKMNNHISVHHSTERKRNYKCSLCDKAFYNSTKLRDHEERHRNKETKPYQCEICGARNDLYIHKRLSHLNLKFPSTNRKRAKPKQQKNMANEEIAK